ncbi:uncharacterized protein SCDLUD_001489 [Saccharomycodes ludwigii]|uniref:uncharacterized protein n=1 Tax=Saccharomycodes ludwigii TaxID=36035 RepID=UPI001E846C41|nr:hypothetical protein SCDLUD_001489 [Saccharomycodes ludwigii]KAH3901716.1 hypothetical protein SCDLUD_001489 [Saccharomycodes ludwigii]
MNDEVQDVHINTEKITLKDKNLNTSADFFSIKKNNFKSFFNRLHYGCIADTKKDKQRIPIVTRTKLTNVFGLLLHSLLENNNTDIDKFKHHISLRFLNETTFNKNVEQQILYYESTKNHSNRNKYEVQVNTVIISSPSKIYRIKSNIKLPLVNNNNIKVYYLEYKIHPHFLKSCKIYEKYVILSDKGNAYGDNMLVNIKSDFKPAIKPNINNIAQFDKIIIRKNSAKPRNYFNIKDQVNNKKIQKTEELIKYMYLEKLILSGDLIQSRYNMNIVKSPNIELKTLTNDKNGSKSTVRKKKFNVDCEDIYKQTKVSNKENYNDTSLLVDINKLSLHELFCYDEAGFKTLMPLNSTLQKYELLYRKNQILLKEISKTLEKVQTLSKILSKYDDGCHLRTTINNIFNQSDKDKTIFYKALNENLDMQLYLKWWNSLSTLQKLRLNARKKRMDLKQSLF